MALNFPTNPNDQDTFVLAGTGKTYRYHTLNDRWTIDESIAPITAVSAGSMANYDGVVDWPAGPNTFEDNDVVMMWDNSASGWRGMTVTDFEAAISTRGNIGGGGGGGTVTTVEVLNTSGNWTVPAGVEEVFAVIVGGGGGSGKRSAGSTSGTDCSNGGLGGLSSNFFAVTPGDTITYTVGTGGNGNNTGSGAAGGTSTFSGLNATGGSGGRAGSNVNPGGTGFGAATSGSGTGSGLYSGDSTALQGTVVPAITFGFSASMLDAQNQINGDTGAPTQAGGTYTLNGGIRPGSGGGLSAASSHRGHDGAIFLFY